MPCVEWSVDRDPRRFHVISWPDVGRISNKGRSTIWSQRIANRKRRHFP
jgi:hypothetical protein